ncbi:EF-hand domain-containing protein [Ectothiorhodospiraceae bacterium 2226]|nr:EF-hand domain-containing protein [Ectothiorhodospiraceae bacterium 2226]
MAFKDKAALVLALSMFSGASMAAGMGGEDPGAGAGAGMDQPGMAEPGVGMNGEGTAELTGEDRDRFEQLDQAGTGEITREEAQADPQLSQQFDEIDRNQDGVIDESEFAQFMEEQDGAAPGVGEEPTTPGMDDPGVGGEPGTEPGGEPGGEPGMGGGGL